MVLLNPALYFREYVLTSPEFIYMYANFTVGVIEPALHFQHFAFAMLTLYRLHSWWPCTPPFIYRRTSLSLVTLYILISQLVLLYLVSHFNKYAFWSLNLYIPISQSVVLNPLYMSKVCHGVDSLIHTDFIVWWPWILCYINVSPCILRHSSTMAKFENETLVICYVALISSYIYWDMRLLSELFDKPTFRNTNWRCWDYTYRFHSYCHWIPPYTYRSTNWCYTWPRSDMDYIPISQ